MSKYTDLRYTPEIILKDVWMLQAIANELAEANRLKRIELRSMFVLENSRIENVRNNVIFALDDSNDFMKELKDRA